MQNIFKPILFSTPMVQAILEGRKTQTRRTKGLAINKNPDNYFLDPHAKQKDVYVFSNKEMTQGFIPSSPYEIGTILWVRETFYPKEINSEPPGDLAHYKASDPFASDKWKPSIFMPKKVCRIFLEVIGVSVERLKDITVLGAEYEGVEVRIVDGFEEYKDYLAKGTNEYDTWGETYYPGNSRLSFMSLWQSINGLDSWDLNPWVWVIKFARIDKPLDFI